MKSVEVSFFPRLIVSSLVLREDTWVSPVKPVEEANAKDENVDRFPLTRVGLNPDVYKFERKASQLDATINLLSQVLDERLQAERLEIILTLMMLV